MPDGREPTSVKVVPAISDVPAGRVGRLRRRGRSLSSATPSSRRWRTAARSRLEPAGSPSTWSWRTRRAKCLPARPFISRDTPMASTFSTGAGPTPTSGPAGAIILNSCRRCRSRRSPGGASWCARTPPRKLADVLVGGMVQLAERFGVSSLHVNFPTEAEWRRLTHAGLIPRLGQQFHWEKQGLRVLRGLPRHPQFPQAQGGAQGAPRRAGQRHRHPRAFRRRHRSAPLGRLLSGSTAIPRNASGARPISTATSSNACTRRWASGWC